MKKELLFGSLLLCFSIALMGCGKTQPTSSDVTSEKVVEDTNQCSTENVESEVEDAETEATASVEEPVVSDWTAGEDVDYSFSVNAAAFVTKDCGLTVGNSGEIHYTSDGGNTWPQADNESRCIFGFDYVTEDLIFAVGNGAHVIKSIDGGKTFSHVTDFGGSSPNQCKLVSFFDENNGIIASSRKMGITHDGGTTWMELDIPVGVAGMEMLSEQKIYYIGSDLNLYKSEDGGISWSNAPLNLPEQSDYNSIIQSFAFRVNGNEIDLYVAQKSTKIIKNYFSTDDGLTWEEKPMPVVEGHVALYLNHTGDILSATNVSKGSQINLIHS